MATKKELLIAFEEEKGIEETAERYYRDLARKVKDEKIQKTLLSIAADENRHARIAQDIIDIIKSE